MLHSDPHHRAKAALNEEESAVGPGAEKCHQTVERVWVSNARDDAVERDFFGCKLIRDDNPAATSQQWTNTWASMAECSNNDFSWLPMTTMPQKYSPTSAGRSETLVQWRRLLAALWCRSRPRASRSFSRRQ